MSTTHPQSPAPAALVTGGGSGIGRSIAVSLAEAGYAVTVTGRRASALAETADLHDGIDAQVADIADLEQCTAVVAATVQRHGRLDVLVNNAGIGYPGAVAAIDEELSRRTWAVNVLAPALLTRAALPHLRETAGCVVNVSSTFGSRPAPGLSMYGASKAALEHLTRSWALELAPDGVRVNAVAPGPTCSEALGNMGMTSEEVEQVKQRESDRIPMGRRGEPDDVTPWVVALAVPSASWTTGQVIAVDGGYALGDVAG